MIQTIIADDSPFFRQVLIDLLHKSGTIEVVAQAKNGKEAVDLVKRLSVDILILDHEMPIMTGLQALCILMKECPLPVFMLSSLTHAGSSVTLKALECGAVDFLPKPTKGAHDLEAVADDLIKKIEHFGNKGKYQKLYAHQKQRVHPQSEDFNNLKKSNIDIIAVGSSTGGVQAAVEILSRLPKNTKPIVWVQHMPPSFTKGFSQRLNSLSQMNIKEAENKDPLEPGTCYIAPGGFQMKVIKQGTRHTLSIEGQEKVNRHCPSCNVLFESVSELFTTNALGVILTGMGNDGTQGLVKMHNNGSFIIGQDEASSVIYGMPKTAFEANAVDIQCDIKNIASAIIKKSGRA